MSTVNAQALSAELERRLAPYGIDAAAAAWLLKALHPASPGSSPGIPDSSYVHSVRPEFRSQTIIAAPPALASPTWDLLIWRRGGDVSTTLWCAAPGGTDFQGSSPPAGSASGFVTIQDSDWTTDGNLDAVEPSAAPGDVFPYGRVVSTDGVYSWRTQFASLTAYLTASALNDQGTVFSTQMQREVVRREQIAVNTSTVSPTGSPLLVAGAVTSVPFEENEMLLMDPKAYTAPAREGVYMPIRLSGPVQDFTRPCVRPSGLLRGTAHVWGYITSVPGQGPTTDSSVVPLSLGATTQDYNTGFNIFSLTSHLAYNFSYDNVHQGVTIFRGLSPSASVTLKLYTGLEQEPGITSVTRQFARVPNVYNPRAMEAYYRLVHELPTSYPASFNSLGTIMSAISNVASRLWPVVQKVVPAIGSGVRAAIEEYRRRSNPTPDLAQIQKVVTPPTPSLPKLRARSRSQSVSRVAQPKKKAKRRVRVVSQSSQQS
jgi:hypothetical protein